MQPPLLIVLALSLFAPQSSLELRAALNALRAGAPGEPAFEAALPRLPELLASQSGWFVEGAAHLAGKHGRRECGPALLAALAHENRRPEEGSLEPTRALLDALIRLELAAPTELVLARPAAELAPALYLALARAEERDERAAGLARLLELGWVATEAHWAAACSLTAAQDPRAARWLVAGAPWSLRLAVRDPGSQEEILETFGGGFWSRSHERWPPRVDYDLALPGPGEALEAITFTRTERGRRGPIPSTLPAERILAWRARLLDALVGREVSLGAKSVTAYLARQDAPSIERALAAHVGSVRARIRAAAEALAERGLLGDVEPLLASLKFQVALHDLRADRTLPLALPRPSAGVEYYLR